MNWAVHLAADLLIALAVAAALARGRPALSEIVARFWPMAVANLIDVDHLLARPIFDASRCSIGFHPLHEPILFPLYAASLLWRRARWFSAGLLTHVGLDALDCIM